MCVTCVFRLVFSYEEEERHRRQLPNKKRTANANANTNEGSTQDGENQQQDGDNANDGGYDDDVDVDDDDDMLQTNTASSNDGGRLSRAQDEIIQIVPREGGIIETMFENTIMAHWTDDDLASQHVMWQQKMLMMQQHKTATASTTASTTAAMQHNAATTTVAAWNSASPSASPSASFRGGGDAGNGGDGSDAKKKSWLKNRAGGGVAVQLARACAAAHKAVTLTALKARGVSVAAGISHCNDALVGVAGTSSVQRLLIHGSSLHEAAHLAKLAERLHLGVALPWAYDQLLSEDFAFRFMGTADLGVVANRLMWVAEMVAPVDDKMFDHTENLKDMIDAYNDALKALSRSGDSQPCRNLSMQPRLPMWLAEDLRLILRRKKVPSYTVPTVW